MACFGAGRFRVGRLCVSRLFRKLRYDRRVLCNFLCGSLVAVIFAAAVAVPVLNIALGVLGRSLCRNMLKVDMILHIQAAIFLSAIAPYSLSPPVALTVPIL